MFDAAVIENLTTLGFSVYEAKCYWVILNNPEINGTEISRIAEVPRAKVYGVLQGLIDKGVVHRVEEDSGKYVSLPLEEIFARQRSKLDNTITFLKDALKPRPKQHNVEMIWNIIGYDNVLLKAKSVIDNSEKVLFIAAAENEMPHFIDSLIGVEKNGVDVFYLTTSRQPYPLKNVFRHEAEGTEKKVSDLGNFTAIVSDHKEVFLGSLFQDTRKQSHAIWTQNALIIRITEEYILHEIHVTHIFDKFRTQLNAEFGPNLAKIRRKLGELYFSQD